MFLIKQNILLVFKSSLGKFIQIQRKMSHISKTPVWLDCDPGHDDAFAILLAAYSPEINLLGISIVHGNDTVEHCAKNAIRFIWASGITNIPVYQGVNSPIVRKAKHCPQIHGLPGEDGVAGMCGYHFPDEVIFSNSEYKLKEGHGVIKMYEEIMKHPTKVTLVATGAQTNVALAIKMFPNIKNNLEKIVFMGGAIGVGNTGVAAEFNIEIDPEATHILLHSGIPLVMVPLEVTHSVLVTPQILKNIENIDKFCGLDDSEDKDKNNENYYPQRHVEYKELFKRIEEISKNSKQEVLEFNASKCTSNYTSCCVQLLTFFGSTYKSIFSFDFPPLHDPCAVFYVTNPQAFKSKEMYVDVEIDGQKSLGRTLCDIYGLSKKTPNVTVCYEVNVFQVWDKLLNCVKIANQKSPLNK